LKPTKGQQGGSESSHCTIVDKTSDLLPSKKRNKNEVNKKKSVNVLSVNEKLYFELIEKVEEEKSNKSIN
jgi:hypothetical protein